MTVSKPPTSSQTAGAGGRPATGRARASIAGWNSPSQVDWATHPPNTSGWPSASDSAASPPSEMPPTTRPDGAASVR